jgi:hypothetical protein
VTHILRRVSIRSRPFDSLIKGVTWDAARQGFARGAGGGAEALGRTITMNRPGIVSRPEWLGARKALLVKEKKFTRQRTR